MFLLITSLQLNHLLDIILNFLSNHTRGNLLHCFNSCFPQKPALSRDRQFFPQTNPGKGHFGIRDAGF